MPDRADTPIWDAVTGRHHRSMWSWLEEMSDPASLRTGLGDAGLYHHVPRRMRAPNLVAVVADAWGINFDTWNDPNAALVVEMLETTQRGVSYYGPAEWVIGDRIVLLADPIVNRFMTVRDLKWLSE